MRLARRMWMLVEPIHAVVYFAPEHRRAQDQAGLKGGWMAYFASRAAPLGPVSAQLVTAAFYNFAPAMVSRAIPDAWRLASPERILDARYAGVGQALSRLVGQADRAALAETAQLLQEAAVGCDLAGRPMFAANASLPWPDELLQRLWHATTLLREHRGDGHVISLLAHEVDGCQAHVLAAGAGVAPVEQLRPNRGWSDEQWQDAVERLRIRGLVSVDGTLTEHGRRLHDAVEELTDQLAAEPGRRLGSEGVDRLTHLLAPVLAELHAARAVPYPNPMGFPAPSPSP